ncbi:NINE protein [Agromyces archimandritae]|uniref:NINE protein n=1 Tax=Agromyces archimandritae TaxID=2781962 RepID=A0A975IR23_9MICO|nr:NINE protein [Agromyces archimandritae]QTX05646.1 NINE protein [Agromyces archimandritae]
MTDAQHTAPAGWYPDPETKHLRWWDGTRWAQFAPPTSQPYAPPPPWKSTGAAIALCLLLGAFGADRFYLRHPGQGVTIIILWWVGWALTPVMVGWVPVIIAAIWMLVNLFTIPDDVNRLNTVIAAEAHERRP